MGEPSNHLTSLDRINSWAKAHASRRTVFAGDQRSVLPVSNQPADTTPNAHSRTTTPRSAPAAPGRANSDKPSRSHAADTASAPQPPPGPSSEGHQPSAVEASEKQADKPGLPARMKNGSIRFVKHTKDAVTSSWVNVLLVFVPIGIAAEAVHLSPGLIFAMNAIAIIPLAGLLSHATESVASRLGDTLGALLNVSFGNAVELIIFIALVKNEIRIVQASLLGSILANLLLILGMAFLFGGLRFREQIYNSTVTQMSACLLSLSVMSLLLPTAFHASFQSNDKADDYTLRISRGTSVVLLLVYILYLLFQLKSHAYLYESTPQQIIDEESHPGVLADMLGSSSSSGSSDDSGSDTDSSAGSHTTAKRIRRAFRNRRRRKSSASSKDTPSIPSTLSSPSGPQSVLFESYASPALVTPQEEGGHASLGPILSGDEADDDHEASNVPRVRDFEAGAIKPRSTGSDNKEKKRRKKRSKHHREATSVEQCDKEILRGSGTGTSGEANAAQAQPRVGFSENVQISEHRDHPAYRKSPFNIVKPLRPALPSLLTNTVFSTPPPAPSGSPSLGPGRPRPLRRTNSLPDRLNQTSRLNNLTATNSYPPHPVRNGAPEMNLAMTEVEGVDIAPEMSRTAAVVLLLVSTALVAVCAEFLVDNIPSMVDDSNVSQAFIGLIILPIVGNAAEHVTAVTVAAKNKMDLAIGVAVGSSIQIAIFVTPFVVLLGWFMGKEMTLYFNLFETISLFVTAFVVNFLVLDGRSNYLEGSLLVAAYVIIAVAAFYYPDTEDQSLLGGSESNSTEAIASRMAMALLR